MGGMVKAIERGFPRKKVAEASYQYQREAEAKKRSCGANKFVIERSRHTLVTSTESVERQQSAKVKALKGRR